MTAQAGAVACDVVWPDGGVVATRVDIAYADELLSQYKWRDCKKVNFVYPTPPAAVSVEALEGLIEKAQFLVDGLDEEYVAWPTRVLMLRAELDRLTTLIKERSNG